MSTTSFHTSDATSFRRRAPNGLHWFAARIEAAILEWHSYKAARSVESLSDAALHDIGIARSEIRNAVRYGRDHT